MPRILQPGPIDAPKLQSRGGRYRHLATKVVVVSIILSTAATSAFAQSFAAPVNYPTGGNPYAVATGDFNGDGKLDLASANNFTKNVSVLLGNGDATFGPRTDYDVASYAYGIVCVDLNGDAKLDLATATSVGLDSGISVLLGNGNGTFQAKVDYPFGGLAQPNSLVAADLNNDSKADLVVVNGSGASVILGNGRLGSSWDF